MKRLALVDNLVLKPLNNLEPHKKFFFETKDSHSNTGHSLRVVLAATHSGLVTGNNALYLPDKMRSSVYTMLPYHRRNYSIPMLTHHNKDEDPVGRVESARYVDLTSSYGGQDPMLDALNSGNLIGGKFKKVLDHMQDRYLFGNENWQGTGYIEVTANITNPEAIKKVLDGRYLAVSSSQYTDSAVCSICHTDWLEDGMPCEHRPGSSEDGQKAFLVSGNFEYTEISFINNGADPFGMVIDVDTGNVIMDSKQFKECMEPGDYRGESLLRAFYVSDTKNFELTDKLLEEGSMAKPNKQKQEIEDNIRSVFVEILGEDFSSVSSRLENLEEMEVSVDEFVTNMMKLFKQTYKSDSQEGLEKTKIEDFIEDYYKNHLPEGLKVKEDSEEENIVLLLTDEVRKKFVETTIALFHLTDEETTSFTESLVETPFQEDQNVEELIHNLITDFIIDKDGEVEFTDLMDPEKTWEVVKEQLSALNLLDAIEDKDLYSEDAKLSTEARKRLKSSSFCGPQKSFPIPDCAHVTAAKRLIGRYKGPGSKKAILACVNRKAKSMGCDAVANPVQKETKDSFDPKNFLGGLAKESFTSLVDHLKAEHKNLFEDHDKKVKSLQAHINTLNFLHDQLAEEVGTVRQENKKILAEMKALLTVAKEGKDAIKNYEETMTDYMSRTSDSLKDSINDLKKSTNIHNLSKILDNGLVNDNVVPEENPVTASDDTTNKSEGSENLEIRDSKTKVEESETKLMEERRNAVKYYSFLKSTNPAMATTFHDNMVSKGIFEEALIED